MNEKKNDLLIYYRIVSAWAICESVLGGIIHAIKIPVSGLIVGSAAVLCISLIAWFAPAKGNILKATLLVAIIKMMLSPQAPIPAYFALFFQGLTGELLFHRRKFFRTACILLAVFALMESALQRILVLTLVYGNSFWNVVDKFFSDLSGYGARYSYWIAVVYCGIHIIAGLIVGWQCGLLPKQIDKWTRDPALKISIADEIDTAIPSQTKRRKRRWKVWALWIMLLALYLQSSIPIGHAWLPSQVFLRILIRSSIIVLGWILIISPILLGLLKEWLRKKRSRFASETAILLALLPGTRRIFNESWHHSNEKKGWHRLKLFSKTVLVAIFRSGLRNEVFILTGAIHSGKTTSLVKFLKDKNASGILTPVINGRRFFLDVKSKEQFAMEAERGEMERIDVGRFHFSKRNFEKARNIISANVESIGWLVIDEIGPLELRGEGFAETLKEILKQRHEKILLVVRAGLTDDVKSFFQIEATIVHQTDELPTAE
jgi:nucleoside-triphosphatase THEP1